MRDGQPRSAAIETLCRHLGIGCIRTSGSPSGQLITVWEWRGGCYVTIRINGSHGWAVGARNGGMPWMLAEASNPLDDLGPTAADILAVCRTAGLIPADLPGVLRPAEAMAVRIAKVRTDRRDEIGTTTAAMLLLIIQRLTGGPDYLTEDHHGA